MAMYAVPPTVARFRAMAPKPEVFSGFSDEVIALFLERHSDALQSALGDRATLPILEWDAACDGAVIALAARSVINTRGRNRQAGADDSIDAEADEALAFLDRCRPGTAGADGKRENPRFVDSKQNRPQDAVIVLSAATSDAWSKTRRRCC